MTIRKVEAYLGSRGERVEKIAPIETDVSDDAIPTVFAGVATIMTSQQISPQQNVQIPNEIRFPIDAKTLDEAFENFESALNGFVDMMKKRQEELRNQASQQQQQEIYQPTKEEMEQLKRLRIPETDNS